MAEFERRVKVEKSSGSFCEATPERNQYQAQHFGENHPLIARANIQHKLKGVRNTVGMIKFMKTALI